ncbi:hypothetical protein [Govanella unica]|uniref:DUF2946 domain-containing protein n=1 Tax=Govanella unica TaxID=2975056 RepID=A0A9X3TXE9_9PROT|nr:hypothetical protein [Govania unica]MDA5193450.1 hypothetical protein [Govania unica]
MFAHVLMSFMPTMAAPVPGKELSLAEALAVVCSSSGAESNGKLSHDSCTHCTLCVSVAAKAPLLPLLAIAYPTRQQDVWRFRDQTISLALAPPFARPFAQAPPSQSPITL